MLFEAIIKAPSIAEATVIAEKTLGNYAVVETCSKVVTDTEVRLVVSSIWSTMQRWFNEDANCAPPYGNGSLLVFSPWTKHLGHQIHEAKRELAEAGEAR